MKTSHIFWGVFFVSIGGLLLLGNYTDLDFSWNSAWKFWPMVLVLIGISILVKNQIGKNIVGGLAGIILALTLYASVSATTNLITHDFVFDFDDEDAVYDTTFYSEDYSDSIKTASLVFDAGAGTFKLLAPSEKLVDFRVEGNKTNYRLNRNDSGSHSDITFNMKNTKVRFGKNNFKNSVEMSLNSKPEWELNFDVGAASVDLDLTQYKINKLDIDMGAAAMNIKFGDLAEVTRFKLDAGASDIDILIPDNVGCEIKSDAALSSKNYEDFKRITKDLYRTENFENSTKKIFIDIDCGVSSIDVKKY